MKKLWFIIVLFTFISCHQNISNKQDNNYLNVTIYDSILIKGNRTAISDYNPVTNCYLAFRIKDKDILIVNTKGEIIYSFNHFGEGPKEYGVINDLKFWDTESVVVLNRNTLKRYSNQGEYIDKIKLDTETPIEFRRSLTIFQNSDGDSIVFYVADSLSKNIGIPPPLKQKENYVKRHFFIHSNIRNKKFKRVINLPKESIYNGNNYFSSVIPNYCINKEKRFVDVNFPNEQKIFRYDITKNYKYIKSINISSDFFGDVEGIPWGGKPKNVLSFIQKNSNYIKIYSFADTIVTFYFKGLQEDEINFSIEKMNEEILKIPKCLQLFINEVKIGKDVVLPNRIQHISVVHNLNRIIFLKGPNEFDENHNTNTFLIGKIEYEK